MLCIVISTFIRLHWNLEGLEEELTISKQLLRDMV